jgi:membrane protease YdiL (CAAX protease family)
MSPDSNRALDPDTLATPQPRSGAFAIVLFTVALLTAWSTWAIYLSRYPLFPSLWPIRLLARIMILLIPATFYIRLYLKQPIIRYLRLETGNFRGLAYGCLAGLLPLASLIYQSIRAHKLPALPASTEIWFNVILVAPITEEILFRGLLFREFSRLINPIRALFAALHFPYWYTSHAKTGYDLLASLTFIFAIGLLCSALTHFSRTLTASITFHIINNLASSCAI